MIEQQLFDRFRAAVADEPPLGFDPDDVVDRAQRTHRRRSAILAASAATAGCVILAAVVALQLVPSGGGQGGVPGSAPTTAKPAETVPPETKRAQPEHPADGQPFTGADEVISRLGQVIPVVLAERVPGLTFGAPDSGELMPVENRRGVGGAYRAAGTKHRYVSVWVYHDQKTGLDLAGDPAAAGGWGQLVSDTTRPDGSHLRVYQFAGTAQGLLVVHLRTDGVIVMADTTAKPEPGRQGLAVSQEVLAAIATDERLTF